MIREVRFEWKLTVDIQDDVTPKERQEIYDIIVDNIETYHNFDGVMTIELGE